VDEVDAIRIGVAGIVILFCKLVEARHAAPIGRSGERTEDKENRLCGKE
jgi:hypothetical protein